jgi:hypothetical protein
MKWREVTKLTSSVQQRNYSPQKCVINFVLLQFSGPRTWYLVLHNSNDVENNLDCPESLISGLEGNRSIFTTDVYVVRWVHNIDSFFTAILRQ